MGTSGLASYYSRTRFQLHDGCEDVRNQYWRYVTYQFTHIGLAHMLGNVIMQLIMGIPLEKFHGTIRCSIIYVLGVVGGALCFGQYDAHNILAGCSGGVFTLFGMHIGDLFLNWSEQKYRRFILATIFCFSLIQAATIQASWDGKGGASNSAHVGGFVAGICLSLIWGRNIVWLDYERYMKYLAMVVAIFSFLFSVLWIAAFWPPQNVFEYAAGQEVVLC